MKKAWPVLESIYENVEQRRMRRMPGLAPGALQVGENTKSDRPGLSRRDQKGQGRE